MAKGFRSGGVDFDDLFDPDIVGDGPSVPNLRSGGVALRYAKLSYGTKRADVGYRQNGVDVSNLWAAKGTAVYTLGFNGQGYAALDQSLTTAAQTRANLTLLMNANGTWVITRSRQNFNGGAAEQIASGTWNTYGEPASNFEVAFDVSQYGGNTAAAVGGAGGVFNNLGTGRNVTATLGPYTGADTTLRDAGLSVRCRVRRVGGGVMTDSTCSFSLQTQGSL